MLKFSKKTDYALIAMADMTEYTDSENLITAKALADQHQIPQEILGKVLQTLVREGLLISVQGVRGGYALALSAKTIKLKQIIEAIEGPISLISCYDKNHIPCGQIASCAIKTPIEYIQSELAGFFDSISLQDLKANQSGYNFTNK